jgi:manganese/zinc/iron transport system substrate-binding protein
MSINRLANRTWGVLTIAALVALSLAGCTQSTGNEPEADGRLRATCTSSQVGDLVQNVGGDLVRVHTLMGQGVDPHLYKATPSDVRHLKEADIVFYNGLHLEGRMTDLLENLAERKPVHEVIERIEATSPDRLRQAAGFAGNYDPHIWFDVDLWADCAIAVADDLAAVDPANATKYRENAAAYRQRLARLRDESAARLAEIPKDQRVLVTAHDAFGYFGRAFGLEVLGMQGISTLDEADLAHVNELVSVLVDRKIKAVFVESSVPPRNIQSLVEGCEAQGHTVKVGGELYSDAMGPPGTPEGTYEGMVRHNVNTIADALR